MEKAVVSAGGDLPTAREIRRSKQNIRKILRRLLLVIMVVIIGLFFLSHYEYKKYRHGDEQEFLNKVCQMTGNKNVAVGIMDGNKDVFLNYCGVKGQIVDENTLFELGSTTKAFTGLGILRLEEEGLLNGNDPVTDYIEWFRPTYKGTEARITINDLMNHSSGIPVWTISLIPEGSIGEINLEDTVREIAECQLTHAPGESHVYATINYDILALIIEKVTGQRYEDYISSTILNDAGLTESFFRISDTDRERIVQGEKDGFFLTWSYDAPTYYGNTAAGYLVSNASDLVKWMRYAKINIDYESFPVTDSNDYYAGWHLYPETVYHGGNNPNYGTQIIISRDKEFGVFVLSASDGNVATMIADGIFGMHMGQEVSIGLYCSSHELIDLVFVLGTLLIIYIALLLKYKYKKACLCGAGGILAGMILMPVISHFSYRFLFVWMPFSFIALITALSAFAIWLAIIGLTGVITKRG